MRWQSALRTGQAPRVAVIAFPASAYSMGMTMPRSQRETASAPTRPGRKAPQAKAKQTREAPKQRLAKTTETPTNQTTTRPKTAHQAAATTATKEAATKRSASPKTTTKETVSSKETVSTKETSSKEAKGSRTHKATTAAKTDPRAEFLAGQKTALLAERATYLKQAEELKAQADSLALEHEPGDVQFDEEGGEGGTSNVDRELDLLLSAQARASITEIDVALAKIDNGTYGLCEQCGAVIPEARLEALPHAALCVACKNGGLSSRR
jgi:RNA polymerase-binding transcription factor